MNDKGNPLVQPYNSRIASYVRGVNLGGWMILERYITPYMFAVTDCHLSGDFCWYPGQLSTPKEATASGSGGAADRTTAVELCNLFTCTPMRSTTVFGDVDYPLDEYTLAMAFHNYHHTTLDGNPSKKNTTSASSTRIAAEWLNYHFKNFITKQDIEKLHHAGVTHVRVPLPHWILGNVLPGEPWIVADRWKYFVRLLGWCREYQIQVWPDIHTAPGSQNGFDNSGQSMTEISCKRWSDTPEHVQRSLQVIQDIVHEIATLGYQDVVTGFGLLNEPFKDCDRDVYLNFTDTGLNIVRNALGPDTAVYVSDLFMSDTFNTGRWWIDPLRYNNTFLDSHYYHVFAEEPRALSPRQHIAFVCQNEFRETTNCCYEDAPKNKRPAVGVSRMVGEWSAAYDTLPVAMLEAIMDAIYANGTALHLDRKLSAARQDFLRNFVQAQMVTYEAAHVGTTSAWFYWTVKMEGGAFAEWDFLRGIREGWIPKIPPPNVTSESLYQTCYDIIFRTNDDMSVIQEFPDPTTLPPPSWRMPIDDDVVVTHGESLLSGRHFHRNEFSATSRWVFVGLVLLFVMSIWRIYFKKGGSLKKGYTPINGDEPGISV